MNVSAAHISYGELPEDFVKLITSLVHSHTTILIKVPKRTTSIADTDQIGSGTFVRFGDDFGILTATHVVNLIDATDSLGLFLLEAKAHNFFLSPREYRISRIGTFRNEDEDWAQDLSFISIAKERVGTIGTFKSFVNLEKQEENVADLINDLESSDFQRGVWMFTGIPAEKTKTDIPPEGGFRTANEYLMLSNLAPPERYSTKNECDFIDIKTLSDKPKKSSQPRQFHGSSGGGIWRVLVDAGQQASLKPVAYQLTGVLTDEYWKGEDTYMVRGHGPRSLFHIALPKLRLTNTSQR